jgi:hypothetical protein
MALWRMMRMAVRGVAGVSRSARQVYQHQAQLAKAVLFRVLRCAAGGAE